ncbi:MAG: pentapeptide repeat-containing protein, partial [Coleofasciculaceae cyanobacterium SM2_3_26]|nr:pentapeptide repeat-containing protein [Coleofasciculaceae cyanobacterium SM2_3_26]
MSLGGFGNRDRPHGGRIGGGGGRGRGGGRVGRLRRRREVGRGAGADPGGDPGARSCGAAGAWRVSRWGLVLVLALGCSREQAERSGEQIESMRGKDLRKADLRGEDLRGRDLSDADLRDAVLDGVDLRGATLDGVDPRQLHTLAARPIEANLR